MEFNLLFVFNSVLFGFGLAMDAFSVSIANGLRETDLRPRRVAVIAGTFGAFQTVMPLLGWLCVHTIAETFRACQPFIPWIALGLLSWIGGKMILDAVRKKEDEAVPPLRGRTLFVQGVATSIDALSVGFTIAEYTPVFALAESVIIGAVTFGLCAAGLHFGRRIGARFTGKAAVAGGIVLILIGLEILITGLAG